MPRYEYTPLIPDTGHIRLVHLHPAHFDDPIRISIVVATLRSEQPTERGKEKVHDELPAGWKTWENLEGRTVFFNETDECSSWENPTAFSRQQQPDPFRDTAQLPSNEPTYEALSYTWGSYNSRVMITVVPTSQSTSNLTETFTDLEVGPNLFEALKYLRNQTSSRVFWVDALCINQADLLERNYQVSRMSSIYKYAQRVVVWIGPSANDSELAFKTLDYVGRQLDYTINHLWLPAPDCTEKGWWNFRRKPSFDSDTWQAIYFLLLRPWFGRLWVAQEIQLANEHSYLQCGGDKILWRHLRRAILACREVAPTNKALDDALQRLFHLCVDCRGQNSIVLLEYARNTQCSEPRDKIYALLGLVPYALAAEIRPQYTLSVQEVYKQAFFAYLKCTGSVDALCYAGNSYSPSWLPNWEMPTGTHGIPTASAACGHSDAEVVHLLPNNLQVTGVFHDTIQEVSEPPLYHLAFQYHLITTMHMFFLANASPDCKYPTGQTLEEACAWVLSCAQLQERWPDAQYPTVADAIALFDHHRRGISSPLLFENVQFWREQTSRLDGKTFFMTEKGCFGISKGTARVGDKICVLLGCPLPLVLRKVSPHEDELVGCAFVHGIMDGEAILGPLLGHYRVHRKLPWDAGRSDVIHQTFFDTTSLRSSNQDPRLEPLKAEWEMMEVPRDEIWPFRILEAFRNKTTGQVRKSDPRMDPETLRVRGVTLQSFTLI